MVRKIDSDLKASILTLYQLDYSSRKIVATLRSQDKVVSKTTVLKVIDRYEKERLGYPLSPLKSWNRGLPEIRTKSLIAKVKRNITGPNPLSQPALAKKLHVSVSTVHRVIHKNLAGVLRKKYKVHALSNAQVQQRLERGPGFLRYLGPRNLKYIITVDEAWVYLVNANGNREIYYEFKGERTEESWTKFWQTSHPVGIMFFGGICWNGTTTLRFIDPGAKINSDYYIEHCLKPLIEEDVPRLYPGEERKVILHQDSAPAHASKKTQEYLRNSGIKFIPAEEWMGNSPDLAPMDFGVNGKYKRELFEKEANTLLGLKRVMKTVWDGLDLNFIRNTLLSWPKRVELMIERGGLQIEHILKGGKKI